MKSIKSIKSIQIAPKFSEIVVTDYTISTTFAGGLVYSSLSFPSVRSRYSDQSIKFAFSYYIVLCSKFWQVEDCLNRLFNIDGILL